MFLFIIVLLGCPAFSLFIQKCFEPHMIFRRYFLLLNYLHIKWNRRGKDTRKWYKKLGHKLLSLFGLCVYCQNFWVTALVYVPMIILLDWVGVGLLLLIPVMGLSYVILEWYIKILKLWE